VARIHLIIFSALASLALVGAPQALATPVVYGFTGTVTFQNGEFAGQGSEVTGTFRFDDGLVDGNANDDVAQYSKAIAANAPLAAGFSYSLSVGAVTKTGSGDVGTAAHLQLFDDETQPNDQLMFIVGTAPFDVLGLRALQGSGSALVLPQNPPGGFSPTSDAVSVLNGLDLAQFGSTASYWGAGSNQVQFTWDSVTPIPEPSTGLLVGLGLLGLRLARRPSC